MATGNYRDPIAERKENEVKEESTKEETTEASNEDEVEFDDL